MKLNISNLSLVKINYFYFDNQIYNKIINLSIFKVCLKYNFIFMLFLKFLSYMTSLPIFSIFMFIKKINIFFSALDTNSNINVNNNSIIIICSIIGIALSSLVAMTCCVCLHNENVDLSNKIDDLKYKNSILIEDNDYLNNVNIHLSDKVEDLSIKNSFLEQKVKLQNIDLNRRIPAKSLIKKDVFLDNVELIKMNYSLVDNMSNYLSDINSRLRFLCMNYFRENIGNIDNLPTRNNNSGPNRWDLFIRFLFIFSNFCVYIFLVIIYKYF